MKRRCAALLLTLALTLPLGLPAAAMETATPPGESWRVDEEMFKEQYMADYTARHQEEYEAFDADTWYEESSCELTKEEYMALFDWDEEDFRRELWRESLKLKDQAQNAFRAYIVEEYEKVYPGELEEKGMDWALMVYGVEAVEEWAAELYGGDVEASRRDLAAFYVDTRRGAAYTHEETLKYQAQYPGSYENYNPDKGYEGYWAHQKQSAIDRYGLQNEVEWKEYMYVRYIEDGYYAREQERAAKREEYPQRWPEEYAAFDAEAWFAGYYSLVGITPEDYRTQEGLDAAGFKLRMFAEWAGQEECFFNGYCVTVNGTPIQFQFYRDLNGEIAVPKTENGRILIPVRAAAEALGLTVEYRPETNQVTCTGEAGSVWFTLNRTDYSGGVLDAAPYAENGITYLPLRALGEALGCAVTWNPEFSTAMLTPAP